MGRGFEPASEWIDEESNAYTLCTFEQKLQYIEIYQTAVIHYRLLVHLKEHGPAVGHTLVVIPHASIDLERLQSPHHLLPVHEQRVAAIWSSLVVKPQLAPHQLGGIARA